MSELLQMKCTPPGLRKQLLATASALALMGLASVARAYDAPVSGRPQLWIELGGQFDTEDDSAQTWMPPNAPPPLVQPAFAPFGRMPGVGYDWDGKISIQPNRSDWVFSASIQFGKAKRGPRSVHDQDNPTGYNPFGLPAPPTYAFTDSHEVSDTRHLILDFQAGKDLGIGLFAHGSSTVSLGIRMAQFTEGVSGTMTAVVSARYKYNAGVHHDADLHAERSFSGVGPSIDWKASIPLMGSLDDGIALDWGANAAVLFGRQKANVVLRTKGIQVNVPFTGTATSVLLTHSTSVSARRKNVIVPNVGGFGGVSYNLGGRGKISLGYRADFFFGAIDGGIAARKSETRGFYGPFARISIGLGE